MTPEQQAAYDAILGMAQRVTVRIAALPPDQQAAAVKVARETIMENVTLHGITDPDVVNIFAVGVALALRDVDKAPSQGGSL
jgi:hypothetical protein